MSRCLCLCLSHKFFFLRLFSLRIGRCVKEIKWHLPARCPCKSQHHLLHVQWNWRDQCESDHGTQIFEMVHEDVAHQSMETLVVLHLAEKRSLLSICKRKGKNSESENT